MNSRKETIAHIKRCFVVFIALVAVLGSAHAAQREIFTVRGVGGHQIAQTAWDVSDLEVPLKWRSS